MLKIVGKREGILDVFKLYLSEAGALTTPLDGKSDLNRASDS